MIRLSTGARAAAVAGLAAFSVLAGTTVGHAYWSASTTAALGTGAATLAVSSTGFDATVFGNSALVATGSITITNTTSTTSSQSESLKVTFSRASGDTALAAATTLSAWPAVSASACTASAAPSGGASGSWSAGVTVTGSLAPGAAITYCLRNSVADRQDIAAPAGTWSFTARAAITLTVGNFTGGATPVSTISTQYVYPMGSVGAGWWSYIMRAGTTWCWDVSGQDTESGALLISYACKNNDDANQDFRFVDSDDDGYGDIRPRHATALRVAATGTASGSAVTMITSNSATGQQWQPQLVSSGTYQFVNRASGLCLSMPAVSTGPATQVTCTGGADQLFTFAQRSAIAISGITCANSGTTTARTVGYSWTTDCAGVPYTIQARPQASSGAWTTIATATAATATAATAAIPTPFTTARTYDVQFLNSTGQVVGTSTMVVSRQTGGNAYYYTRCS